MGRTGRKNHDCRRLLAVAGTVLLGLVASPAIAAPEPSAKLVRCGAQSCLKVVGHRKDPASIVRINGYPVTVDGKRKWKAYLPVDVVRGWSVPNARTIEVSLGTPEGQQQTWASVALPIGMLAREINLASLVVSIR